jgi:hypothetical protein
VLDGKLVQRAALTGIVLQVALAVLSHTVPWVRVHAWEFAALMIAGLVGLFYGRDFAQGYAKGALGGAIAGGTSGLFAASAANILGDVPLLAIPVGTAVAILVGAIGGLFGQMSANIAKLNS